MKKMLALTLALVMALRLWRRHHGQWGCPGGKPGDQFPCGNRYAGPSPRGRPDRY